jgi:hypothetical protein
LLATAAVVVSSSAVAALAPRDAASAISATELHDFMVQNVCVHNDVVTSIDPVACPTTSGYVQRDLAVGEDLPYHKLSQVRTDDRQVSDSFPIKQPDGSIRYIHTFDYAIRYNADGTIVNNGEAPGEWNYDIDIHTSGGQLINPSGLVDGFNIDETEGRYAAIIGTQDPAGGRQSFMHNTGAGTCTAQDSWLLFPTNIAGYGDTGSSPATLKIYNASGCPTSPDQALTKWDVHSSFTYFNGASLATLTSWHFGGATEATATHIEKFYYTKEYGLTRWERWQTSGSPSVYGCNGSDTTGSFIRVDCRDWTVIEPDVMGGYSPYNIPLDYYSDPEGTRNAVQDSRFVVNNILRNGDFGKGGGTLIGDGTIWNRISHASTMHWDLVRDGTMSSTLTNRNNYLAISCTDCLGDAVYQDSNFVVGDIPTGTTLTFGGTVRSDSAAQIQVTLFLRDSLGVIKQRRDVVIATDSRWARFADSIVLTDPTVTNLRYTLYPITNNAVFRADNLYLAPTS